MRYGYKYRQDGNIITLGALTVADGTEEIMSVGSNKIAFMITVASTGTNVVLRGEFSNDSTNWKNADPTGSDLTLTTDGVYAIIIEDVNLFMGCRLYWVSSVGGTPTITVQAKVT